VRMKRRYLNRIADRELDLALRSSGAVLIEGPKWCGKTRTAEERASSAIYLQDTDKRKQYLMTLDIQPSLLLEGKTPRLIDEWQTAPILWDGVRFEVDRRGEAGQFILTGSALPSGNEVMHTGTGRIKRMVMRPMTLFESLESNGQVSLNSLLNGNEISGISGLTLNELAFALVRGGWPASVGGSGPFALSHARNYADAVMNTDISQVDGVTRDPDKVHKLMRSLARNMSTTAKLKTIMDDVSGDGRADINSDKTVSSYMNALRRLFVIEDLPAWDPNMISKTALRTSPKRHFVDPSIAAAVLRVSPDGLMKDLSTFGLLFESLCIRDLRVYAEANDGRVFHYRDKNGLKADAIVQLYDGRWGAIEIKMGSNEIEKAAANLIKLKNKIDRDVMGEPSFMAVITATEYAYTREDGVSIVPIGCLKD